MSLDNSYLDFGGPRFVPPHAREARSEFQTIRSLMQLAIVALLIGVLLFQEIELPMTIQALIVILLLWLIGRTNVTPLLVAFQTVLFFREKGRPTMINGAGSLIFVLAVVGLLMFLSRDSFLKRLSKLGVRDVYRSLFAKRVDEPDVAPSVQLQTISSSAESPLVGFVRRMMPAVLFVLFAQVLLVTFPLSPVGSRGDESLAATHQLFSRMPTLLITLTAFVLILSALEWRRLTEPQASMYLRSTMVNFLHSDVRMVIRSRLTFRRRKKRTPSEGPLPFSK